MPSRSSESGCIIIQGYHQNPSWMRTLHYLRCIFSSARGTASRKALNLQRPKKTELSFPHGKIFCATMPLCSSLLKLSRASATVPPAGTALLAMNAIFSKRI